MFQHQFRVSLLAVLAAGVLALSGCGGGSSKTAAPPPDTGMPPMPVTTPVDLSGVDAAATAGMAEIPAGQSMDIGEIAFTCPAGGEACSVTVNADGTATSTGGMATAANSAAYTMRIDEERKAEMAAATKAAGTKEKAIAAEAAQTTDDGLGGSGIPNDGFDAANGTADDELEYTLSIKNEGMGTTVEIGTPTTGDGTTQGVAEPKFVQAMDLGGGSTMHTRTMAADAKGSVMQEVVIVSTDIEDPEAVPFAMFEDAAGAMTQSLTLRKDGETATRGNPNDSISIDAAGTIKTNPANPTGTGAGNEVGLFTLIKSTAFSAGGAGPLTFGGDDPADDDDAAFTARGEYNGAPGEYMCNGGATDCTVTLDDEGKITAVSAGWIFTPDAGVTSDQLDYDYVHYGFWLKKTTNAMGVVNYDEVQTFAGASRAALSDVSAVQGTASYKGGATGVYVKNVYNTDRTLDTATSGHFTASVNLMATFAQKPVSDTDTTGTIAPNMLNTLTGDITDFMLSGGEENMWAVKLSGPIASGGATGTAKGGDGDGSFSATFHGTEATADTPPSAVVGEFNAGFTDGSVAGAFGAQHQKD